MKKIQYITTMGLFFALALVLSALEGLLPPMPFLPPGVKLGLSNIVTMYCLLYLGAGSAYAVVVLKSAFVFITRGATAFFMSFCGGLADNDRAFQRMSAVRRRVITGGNVFGIGRSLYPYGNGRIQRWALFFMDSRS